MESHDLLLRVNIHILWIYFTLRFGGGILNSLTNIILNSLICKLLFIHQESCYSFLFFFKYELEKIYNQDQVIITMISEF